LNAAIISIITEWLSDVKMGYCSDGWWLNQQFCCWELDADLDSGCNSWHLWSTVSVARWFIYVLFAVRYHLPHTPPHTTYCFLGAFVSFSLVSQIRQLMNLRKGRIFLRRVTPRPVSGKVRGRLWDPGDQVHRLGFHHAGIPRFLDVPHQEFDAGNFSPISFWEAAWFAEI